MFQYIDDFLTHLRIEKSASELTLVSYRTDLYQFFNYLAWRYSIECEDVPREALNHKNVRDYLASLQDQGMSRATIARKLATLRSFVRYLCRENILPSNPIASVSTPRQEKRLPEFLYPQEMSMLLEAPDREKTSGIRDRAILETLYGGGMRVSELVGLDVNDVNFDEDYIRLHGKGDKERIAPLGSQARDALLAYLEYSRPLYLKEDHREEKALFLNKFGGRLSSRSIRNIINKYVDELALTQKVSPHTLRHTFATDLLNGGADLRSVQELLGHVRLSTTQIYTHLTKNKIKTIHNQKHPRR
ncbi:MAG TPA: tyrosine recombinase XerC [Syntrophomonadaceae bacterium]|nr:tyrosine recombinase XerC [Syntrophomonadaceae bacterium]